jgi:hypothetical protein
VNLLHAPNPEGNKMRNNRLFVFLATLIIVFGALGTLNTVRPAPASAGLWQGTSTGFKYIDCDNGDSDVFQLTFYQHSSYNGATVKFCWDVDRNGDFWWSTFCTVPMTAPSAGDDLFCGTVFDDSLHDKASSWRIHYLRSGWHVVVHKDRNFADAGLVRWGTGSWVLTNSWNDALSSMRVEN